MADDGETDVRVDVVDEEETVDDVSEFDNDKENVDEAESEMEEVMGMVTDVVGVAEDNTVDTEVGVGKVEGVAVVVNGVVDGGVAVVVMGDVRVVGDVVCGADGRITVGGNEDPP